MKNIKLISVYCIILTFTILLSSCGKSPQEKLIGKWNVTLIQDQNRKDQGTVTFNSDGTVISPDGKQEWEIVKEEKETLEFNIFDIKDGERKLEVSLIANFSSEDPLIMSVKQSSNTKLEFRRKKN